jgi:quercetin dioxygenase-like cupin family protein
VKLLRIDDLRSAGAPNILESFYPGRRFGMGGYHPFRPGEVAHENEVHTHDTEEAFLVLQGKARLPIVGQPTTELNAGDIAIIEPGEDHHLTGDETDPPIVVWFLIER